MLLSTYVYKKKRIDRYLRSQKYNKTYLTHVKDILRKNGVYETVI